MQIIDAHQHFWDPSRGDYSWMPQDNKTLNRKYDLEELSKDSRSIDFESLVRSSKSYFLFKILLSRGIHE